jgi:uncharacterized SAM-binding protein YcdF (DUF218 family)
MKFYLLSLFIQTWILPPGFNILLAFIGFILYQLKWVQTGRILILIAFVSLYLLSMPIVVRWLINRLQDQYPTLDIKQLKVQNAHVALVVLGGGNVKAPEYNDNYRLNEETLNRLHYGIALYHKIQAPMIVSGGNNGNLFGLTEAQLMLKELQENFNIPVIWLEDQSITTKDEAKFMLPTLQKKGINTIYLITNAWHMPRSMYAFNKVFHSAGIKVIPAPMGYRERDKSNPIIFDYLPSLSALNTSTIALHEYIGLIQYHLALSRMLK